MRRIEWLFPVRGQWLGRLFRALSAVFLALFLVSGLRLVELASHLASARGVRVEWSTRWALRERGGPWSSVGAPFQLALGPARLHYFYPGRGYCSSREPVLRVGLMAGVFVLPLLAGWCFLQQEAFSRFVRSLGLLGWGLMLPMGMACGPMGCRTVQPWQILADLLFR
jgi:hypothetical protein